MKFLALSCLLVASSAFAQSNLRIRLYDDHSLKGLMNGIEKKYDVSCGDLKLVNKKEAFKATFTCPGKIPDSMTVIIQAEGSDVMGHIEVETIRIFTAG